jgi:hypothetical protein
MSAQENVAVGFLFMAALFTGCDQPERSCTGFAQGEIERNPTTHSFLAFADFRNECDQEVAFKTVDGVGVNSNLMSCTGECVHKVPPFKDSVLELGVSVWGPGDFQVTCFAVRPEDDSEIDHVVVRGHFEE